jgi:hypothetical protein
MRSVRKSRKTVRLLTTGTENRALVLPDSGIAAAPGPKWQWAQPGAGGAAVALATSPLASGFEALPAELLRRVLLRLDPVGQARVAGVCRHWELVYALGDAMLELDMLPTSPWAHRLLKREGTRAPGHSPSNIVDLTDISTLSDDVAGAWRLRPSSLVRFAEGLTVRPLLLSGLRSLKLISRDRREELLDAALPRPVVLRLVEALAVPGAVPNLAHLQIAGRSSVGADGLRAIGRLLALRSCCLSVDMRDAAELASVANLRSVTELTLLLRFPGWHEGWQAGHDHDIYMQSRLSESLNVLQSALWQLPKLQRLAISGSSHGYTVHVPLSVGSRTLRSLSVSTRKTTLKLIMLPTITPALEELYVCDMMTNRSRVANLCLGACRHCPRLQRLVVHTDRLFTNLEQSVWERCMAHSLSSVPMCEMIQDQESILPHWNMNNENHSTTLEQWLRAVHEVPWSLGDRGVQLLSTAAAAAGPEMLQELVMVVDGMDA